jgi:hypothetical protein
VHWHCHIGGGGIDGDDSFHDGHGYHDDDGEVDDYIDNRGWEYNENCYSIYSTKLI